MRRREEEEEEGKMRLRDGQSRAGASFCSPEELRRRNRKRLDRLDCRERKRSREETERQNKDDRCSSFWVSMPGPSILARRLNSKG